MIEKRTVYSQVEITSEGIVQVRLEKQIVEDGVVIARQYHRTSIEPGADVDATMQVVNAHLVQLGAAAAPVDVVDRVKRITAIEHTPAAVTKFQTDRAAREREMSDRAEK